MARSSKYLLKVSWIAAAVLGVLHFLPFFLNGDHAYIRIHDTLEGELIWLKLLVDSGTQWSFNAADTVPQVMNGLPRSAFPTGLSVNVLFVYLFGTYWGYIFCRIVVHLVGFYSMYRLMRKHFIKDEERHYLAVLIALAFSLLPVFSVFGLSVMGQPLILDVFLGLRAGKKRWQDLAWLIAFPFFSSIVWAAIPLLISLGLFWIYDVIRYKKIRWAYLGGMVLMGFIYALVNYPIFVLAFLNNDFVSHRNAYDLYMFHGPAFKKSLEEALLLFATSHYHVGTMISLPIMIAVLLAGRLKDREIRPALIMFMILLIGLFQGFYPFIEYVLGDHISFLKSFRLNRFNILIPFLWLLVFGITLGLFHRSSVLRPFILPFIIVQLLLNFLGNDEVLHNYRQLLGFQKFPHFRNYMAEDQFASIAQRIGEPKENYRVVSLGLSPTIAQYNGFYTLDGLQSVYDLNYKKQFRKIFVGEIDKSDAIKEYFDGWGNRCYIFSAELGKEYPAYMIDKWQHRQIRNFSFDIQAFMNLGGKYVISAAEIVNHPSIGLKLLDKFEDPVSWWVLYVYEADTLMTR